MSDSTMATDDLNEQVAVEKLRLLFAASAAATYPAAALAVITAIVFWDGANHIALLVWLPIVIGCYAFRMVLANRYGRSITAGTVDTTLWGRYAVILAFGAGASWGVLSFLLNPNDFTGQVFVGFILSGVTASAIPNLGSHVRAAAAFVLPSLVPFIVTMYLQGSADSAAFSLIATLYLGFVFVAVRGIGERIHETVRLRIESAMRERELIANRHDLQEHRDLSALISRVQARFIRDVATHQLFDGFVIDLLAFTHSAFGFLGEVKVDANGAKYLHMHAMTNIAWDDASRLRYEENATRGIEFRNLKSLFGAAISSGKLVIANDPANDPRSCGTPVGHPRLDAFLGIPLYVGDEMIGLIGLANRPGGYDESLVMRLKPLTTTVSHILFSVRAERNRRESEQRLGLARAQLHMCVSETPAAVAMLDADLNLIAYSQRWLQDYGLPQNDYHGSCLYDVVPEIPARWRDSYRRALLGELQDSEEDPLIRRDGSVCWLRWEAKPWRQNNGDIGGLVLFSEDVTKQKKTNDALHAREHLLEQLTERVPGMLYQLRERSDGRSAVLYASAGAQSVLGVPADEFAQNPSLLFDSCIQEDSLPLGDAKARAVESGLLNVTYRTKKNDGTLRWLAVRAEGTRLADASVLWHGYVEDITERRYLEEHCESLRSQANLDCASACSVAQRNDDKFKIEKIGKTR
jgi:PAS domain S-box-containing protein